MTEPLLLASGLRCRFGERVVLDQVGLTLQPGARLCITGRSGSGKSTLLRLLAGLAPAETGEIRIGGRVVTTAGQPVVPPWERELQLVFQDLGLWPTRSVAQHLLDPLRARGIPRTEARARTDSLLASLGLASLRERKPGRLSGGEARRVALARALVLRPRLLLLDEAFSSLDPESREQGFQQLEQALEGTGAAVILVTHDPEEAARLGGDRLHLDEGGHLS